MATVLKSKTHTGLQRSETTNKKYDKIDHIVFTGQQLPAV